MRTPPRLADRLRIRLAVWMLGCRLQDLPSRRRRAVLRELQANLTAAGSECGASEALRRLGSRRELAEAYLQVEYGEHEPRPSLPKALFWAIVIECALPGPLDGDLQASSGTPSGR